MVRVYQRALAEAGYNATRFLEMLSERGGLETARFLIHSSTVSDGFTALWLARRLDLTVERVILKSEYEPLFTEDERQIARARLNEYGYRA